MLFERVELRADPAAAVYVKSETVQVVFATAAGAVTSREGPNHYVRGDALVTGSTGDRWSVSRDRFLARYEPVPPLAPGHAGAYRTRAVPVLAKQFAETFQVRRSADGDWLKGQAGDWLVQYAPGDWGVVAVDKFQRAYRLRQV